MKFGRLLIILCLATVCKLQAQPYSVMNSADILQSFRKLETIGSVLYIAAHPDDENTRLLAYLSREKNLRTGYLSLTRGDGGQNLVGHEQGKELGLIRTHELLAARSIDGAEQFFTRANDFGYSKNPEETLRFWNKDSVLADIVWCIRNFHPDIIICRFPTTGEGGHGHHTASAILAVEAFTAAADSNRFPEQLKYTSVWQTKRIFWNTFNFGGNNTTAEDQLKLDVGLFNPLTGKSYGEIAAESRSMHKSQGFGSARGRGETFEYFKLLAGDSASSDLFEGINQQWKRIPGSEAVQQDINFLKMGYDPFHPENSVYTLIMLYKHLQQINEKDQPEVKYWKQQKLKETEQLLLAVCGIWIEASATSYSAVPGDSIIINTQIIVRNKANVRLQKLNWFGKTDSLVNADLSLNKMNSYRHTDLIPATADYSSPYWLNHSSSNGMYIVNDQQMIGKPVNDPSLNVTYELNIEGLKIKVIRPLVYKSTDPVKGEVYHPFEILPPATVNMTEKNYIFPSSSSRAIHFLIKANRDSVHGRLKLDIPAGWKVDIVNPEFILNSKNEEVTIDATVFPPANGSGKLKAILEIDNKSYTKSITRIEYDHIPYQFILQDAEAGLIRFDLEKGGNHIGYIEGAGDDVAECLRQAGYDVTILTDELLSNTSLSSFNAIVTGIRAYNTDNRLAVHYNKLMDYVKNGGNLVVQYNTNSRIGPMNSKIGPYSFTISRDRVTDETSPVRFIDSSEVVLNTPNKITASDFEGWVQERGIYFATVRDSLYHPVITVNDPGEKEMDGGLIIAPYGNGTFVYTGLAFFRQLPAGVPGAYRFFANLLALNRKE